jgi:transcriptional regulator
MDSNGDLVRWRPEFDEAELAQVARIQGDIEGRLSVFRELREKLGMSQSEFAKLMGRSQSNISKLEARNETRLTLIRELLEKRGGKIRLMVDLDEGVSFELKGF